MLTYENTDEEIEKHNPSMAVQPLGSTEQHGPHLPIFTDSIIALEVGRAIANYFKALLLPPIPYSCSLEHRDYISTIWLKPLTLYAMLRDIVESVKFHGFKVLVIVNGHGANFILKNAIRELNYMFNNNPLTILVDLGSICLRIGKEVDIHAGEIETSLMLYLRPALVRNQGKDFIPKVTRDYLNYVSMREITKEGIWGKPQKASRKRGEELFNKIVKEAISYIENILKLTKIQLE